MAEDSDQEVPPPEREPYRQTIVAELAFVRTRVSFEQALMAWIRTCVSLYSFGFSMTKFFDYMEEKDGASEISQGPQRLGVALIVLGLVAILLAMVEHVYMLRELKKEGMPIIRRHSLPFGTAAALLIIGVLALLNIALG